MQIPATDRTQYGSYAELSEEGGIGKAKFIISNVQRQQTLMRSSNDPSSPSESIRTLPRKLDALRTHQTVSNVSSAFRSYLSNWLTLFFFFGFIFVILLAIFGPVLAPYEQDAIQRGAEGEMLRVAPPSFEHPLGTTYRGHDVLSRFLIGARPTVLTGLVGGAIIVSLGLTMGVSSGYYGGRTDNILMRITDFAFGIPIIPTAIVLVAYFGMGFWSSVLVVGLLLWRGNARVFRSQVLQIKEREHVNVAKMFGASNFHVITRHIIPNMVGMIVLFFALATGITILITASLAFLGFMDPFTPSWGVMLRNAYGSGYMSSAWWWTLPPGFAITFTVLTVFMLGRGYEREMQENVEVVA